MRIRAISFLFVLIFAGVAAKADTCSSLSGNLVKNCGFETGDFSGWTGTTTTNRFSGVDSSSPYQGNYEAYLGAQGTPTTLSQSLLTTLGQVYTINFALMNDTDGDPTSPNYFSLNFGNILLFSETNVVASDYRLLSFQGIATGSSTTLSFSSLNTEGDFSLDNVSVVASPAAATTPEPSGFLLAGSGVLGLFGLAKRRAWMAV